MSWQTIAAAVLVLAAAAFLVRRALRKRREAAACDRCAAAVHLRMAKRPDLTPPGSSTRKK
jgi:hypothetical protein